MDHQAECAVERRAAPVAPVEAKRELVEVVSFQDSPDAWREWATTRMQDAERDVELAAQAIVEELGLELAR